MYKWLYSLLQRLQTIFASPSLARCLSSMTSSASVAMASGFNLLSEPVVLYWRLNPLDYLRITLYCKTPSCFDLHEDTCTCTLRSLISQLVSNFLSRPLASLDGWCGSAIDDVRLVGLRLLAPLVADPNARAALRHHAKVCMLFSVVNLWIY